MSLLCVAVNDIFHRSVGSTLILTLTMFGSPYAIDIMTDIALTLRADIERDVSFKIDPAQV